MHACFCVGECVCVCMCVSVGVNWVIGGCVCTYTQTIHATFVTHAVLA